MALAPPRKIVLSDVQVNGTMHEPSKTMYNNNWSRLRPGTPLTLVPDPKNVHDPNAVKICWLGHQIGWVPKVISARVTLDILQKGPLQAVVRSHDYYANQPYNCRLAVDLFREEETAPQAHFHVKELYACEEPSPGYLRQLLKVGSSWRLATNSARTSVTLRQDNGNNLVWFRKEGLPADLNYSGLKAVVLQEKPLAVLLVPLKSSGDGPLSALVAAHTASSSTVSITLAEALEQEIPEASLGVKDVLTQTFTTTTKENTMSKFDTLISANKSAAQTGAIMEAGRIANNQVAKLAAKQLPLMVRGYADTAIGKVIIANLAAQGAAYFRPEDARLAALTSAMMVQAFQVLMQTVDIEGFVDELLDSKDIKRAMSKLSEDGEEVAAPAARGRRAVAEK